MEPSTVALAQALAETRTGDVWLFGGPGDADAAPALDRVAMTVALGDQPPLLWHAALGLGLPDAWTGTPQRGAQLNNAHDAVTRWLQGGSRRCWLRQLTPYADRAQEDLLLGVVAGMTGTPLPVAARLLGRWLRRRVPTPATRGAGLRHGRSGARAAGERTRAGGLRAAYGAETLAITYERMGLLDTSSGYRGPGSFWGGDVPLAPGYVLGREIAVTRR